MAFWETITVRQMGRMLERREIPWLRMRWDKLTGRIRADADNLGNSMNNQERRLSGCSRIPAVHFFLWIALADSQADQEVDFQRLAGRYLPSFDGRDVRSLFNRLYGGGFANTAQAMTRLASELRGAQLDGDTPLGELWTRLKEHNEAAHGAQTEWLISGGLDTLRSHLDAWDGACRELWEVVRDQTVQDICTLIAGGVKQLVLTGAPGTGKTYTAALVARCMGAAFSRPDGEPLPVRLVQFHPSYDYTDFVEGLRPVQIEQVQGNSFVRLDGSFKAFCRQVVLEGERDKLYFFLIDEINRADLSKVFGELMFCLESDKRGKAGKVQTQYRNLPVCQVDEETGFARPLEEDCFADGFYIPENVVILATMNDIDRSVESMDFALRRRFTWMEVGVTREQLEAAFSSGNFCPALAEHAQEVAQQVMALNRVICPDQDGVGRFGLNRHYYVAQGQFSGLPQEISRTDEDRNELDALLRFVWQFRLKSLLQEYVRGENAGEVREFLRACEAAFCGRRLQA